MRRRSARCGSPPGASRFAPCGVQRDVALGCSTGARSTSIASRSRQPTATQGFDGTKKKLPPLVTTETSMLLAELVAHLVGHDGAAKSGPENHYVRHFHPFRRNAIMTMSARSSLIQVSGAGRSRVPRRSRPSEELHGRAPPEDVGCHREDQPCEHRAERAPRGQPARQRGAAEAADDTAGDEDPCQRPVDQPGRRVVERPSSGRRR